MNVSQLTFTGSKGPVPLTLPNSATFADAPIPPLTIYTLGRFAVYRGPELIDDSLWKRRKARSLFKLLLLAPQGQILKDQVFEWLWPEQDPERAANNLHRTLFILRRVLEPNLRNAADSNYVFFRDGKLILNTDAVAWVDVLEFERLIQLGGQQPNPLPHYEAARALYQGDFLPEDLYEDWAGACRQKVRTAYCAMTLQMARLYVLAAAYPEAIACLQDLLRVDSTHEETYRLLMQLYAQTGQRHQSLQLYHHLRQTLHDELEVEPATETEALFQAIAENRWQPTPERTLTTEPTRPLEMPQPSLLLGRESELHRLAELLRQVKAGKGQVIILSGEQGVGKSRLAKETLALARSQGMQVLSGAAYEQEGHLPYGPFVEAIRGGLTGPVQRRLREKLGSLSHDLARLLPELAEASQPVATPLEPELGQERQRLFDAVTSALLALAQPEGLVLFLDDLHAAGESSLQLLHYLARRISQIPILILCTIRAEEAPRGSPVARLCTELLGHQLGQRLELRPLQGSEVSRLCSALLGDSLLAPDLGEAIFGLTEGNPFFIQEIVLALRETDRIKQINHCWGFAAGLVEFGRKPVPPGSGFAIPASIRETIGLRLERLSAEAYRLAGLAAVIGREFSYALLQAASQIEHTRQLDLLEEMLAACLIEETGAGYRFHHGLMRQVLYDELTLHRRIWLHGQVAQALERLHADQLDERAAIFVYHYERAEQYELAFHYLIRAGDRAQATYAPREAMDYFNRAVALCQQRNELATPEMMSNLLQRRAQTHLTLSDFEAAIVDLEQLLENNRRTHDRLREGEALYQVGIAHYWAHRLERAASYLDQAIQLAGQLRYDELQAKALKIRDILNSTQGDMAQTTTLTRVAPGDRAQILPAEEHWGLAMLAHLHSDFDTALHHGQACVEFGQSFSNPFLTLGGYFVVGMSYTSLGHYQSALNHLRHALDLSQTAGDRFWRARLLNTVGWVYRELFDLEQAIQFDQASLELSRAGQPRLTEAEGNALANLATDYLLLQDYDTARAYLDEGLAGSADKPFMRWRYRTRMLVIKGRLALAEDDVLGALAAADESLAMTRANHARKNVARSCKLRGEALLAAGRVHKARESLRHALDIGLSIKSPPLTWPCYVALGHLEEQADRPDVAKTHYFCAAQILNEISTRLDDPALHCSLLTAPAVQRVFERAVC